MTTKKLANRKNRSHVKKLLAMTLVLAMVLSLAGCGSKPAETPTAETTSPTAAPNNPAETVPPTTEAPAVVLNTLMPYPVEEGMTAADPELPAFNTTALRKNIASICFLDTLADAPADAVDASEAQDGTVKAWAEYSGDLCDLYIAAEGGVYAPEDSSFLFAGMESLDSIDFGNAFFTENVVSMRGMFSDTSIKMLDLSCFNTENVTDMSYMFDSCDAISLDISSFNTSNVTDMTYMFCSSDVSELDLRHFDTSKVTNMSAMFMLCLKLKTLDISSFDTSNVTNMSFMFDMCMMLTEVDLSSFNTSKVTDMGMMFMSSGLIKVDISNFDTSNVIYFWSMFGNMSNVQEINFGEFNTENAEYCQGFMSTPEETWRPLFTSGKIKD